jgi:hypothetical protein
MLETELLRMLEEMRVVQEGDRWRCGQCLETLLASLAGSGFSLHGMARTFTYRYRMPARSASPSKQEGETFRQRLRGSPSLLRLCPERHDVSTGALVAWWRIGHAPDVGPWPATPQPDVVASLIRRSAATSWYAAQIAHHPADELETQRTLWCSMPAETH